MAGSITLPCLAFVDPAAATSAYGLFPAIAIDQFGYGFAFMAYMLYMIYFSEGEFKTSHYAICTAFMAQSMMLPGMVAGYLEVATGYIGFFWIVIACCESQSPVTRLIYTGIDPDFGKK